MIPARPQAATRRAEFFPGLRIVSLLTLLSRLLGLVRDMGMAALFGNGAVLDAFTVAFRVPNLARRLFGEGALTTAFIPVFVRELEQAGRESAWKLASAVLTVLSMGLCGFVLLGELLLWSHSFFIETGGEAELLIGLIAALFPYLILICLAAQMSAVLHALGHFSIPALLPVLLNIIWMIGIWCVAPRFSSSWAQIHAISACIVAGGVLQLVSLLPIAFRLGFRYVPNWTSAWPKVLEIAKAMLPVLVALSVTQLNTLADSLMAWFFSEPEIRAAQLAHVDNGAYWLASGTAAALYFGQRMYQFPLGIFGVALGTVLFPVLSRHAERGRLDLLCDDLGLGLRLVISVGLPASAGLVLLAEPITDLLFRHGAFDANDARQTAGMIAAYGSGVWAYCALLIVHRGYYAAGDRQTPLRVGLWIVLLNLALNFALLRPLGGRGLAMATAVSAMLQVVVVLWLLQRRIGLFDWQQLATTVMRAGVATVVMSLVCLWLLGQLESDERLSQRLLAVFVPLTVSMAVYFLLARMFGMQELWQLFRAERNREDSEI